MSSALLTARYASDVRLNPRALQVLSHRLFNGTANFFPRGGISIAGAGPVHAGVEPRCVSRRESKE